jgi:hypothetical protein
MVQAEGSGAERRVRRWRSVAEKRRIVELTLEPGASVALVARAHGVNAKNQATFIGFEVGASALSTLTQYELTKHGHRKPAWIGRAIETGVLAHTVTEQLPAGYDPGADGVEADPSGPVKVPLGKAPTLDLDHHPCFGIRLPGTDRPAAGTLLIRGSAGCGFPQRRSSARPRRTEHSSQLSSARARHS